jgi:hypothetical protein
MPSMGSGAQAGLQDVLARLFLEAQFKHKQQQDAETMALQQARLAEDARQADQSQEINRGNLGLRGKELDRVTGRDAVADQRYTEEAPLRAANLRQTNVETDAILRRPLDQMAAQNAQGERDKTLHGFRMQEIGARSGDSRGNDWQIVQSVNPQTNETVSVRVNRQTGEAQPVSMPGGLQPGGARQTRLSAGQQDDLSTMKTVEDMAGQVEQLGASIGWKGVGGMGGGSISQFGMKHFGTGDPKEEVLRNTIANIQGTIAKLRGGTSFTANEQRLLDSYTPTINDDAKMIQAKLTSLRQFISDKRRNTLEFAGAPTQQAPAGAPPKNNDPLGIR